MQVSSVALFPHLSLGCLGCQGIRWIQECPLLCLFLSLLQGFSPHWSEAGLEGGIGENLACFPPLPLGGASGNDSSPLRLKSTSVYPAGCLSSGSHQETQAGILVSVISLQVGDWMPAMSLTVWDTSSFSQPLPHLGHRLHHNDTSPSHY